MYDVAIIGCGITGSACAYYLSKYRLKIAIIEKNNDVCCGTTRANSAIIHAGYDPVSPEKIHASCDSILRVLEKFPKLILIAAHLGGVNRWDEVAEKLCGKNLYLDTAFCCERIGITVEQGKKIFQKHPHDKILFGSDAPWAKPSEILEFLGKLGLNEDSLELILHKNAERLLGL